MVSQSLWHFLFDLKFFVIVRGDSNYFIEQSTYFPNNDSFAQSYQGYLFLLKLSYLCFRSYVPLILLQLLFSCLAAYSLLRISRKLISFSRVSWISPVIFFFNPISSQWIRYITTDSLFCSLVIIIFYFVSSRNKFKFFLALLLIIFIFFLRPNGVVYVLSFLTIISSFYFSKVFKFLFLFVTFVFLLILYLFTDRFKIAGGNFEGFTLMSNFQDGQVIYDSSQRFMMPSEPTLMSNSFLDLFQYFFLHPYESIILFSNRIFSELIFVRPWYSLSLNVFLFFLILFILSFGFIGFAQNKNIFLRKSLLILVIPQLIFIGITWAIWEGRFGIVFINLFYPLVALGISTFFAFIRSHLFDLMKKENFPSAINI